MTHHSTTAQTPAWPTPSPEVTARAIGHIAELTRAVLADPTLLDQIPNGVTLVLLPDDDPELAAEQVEAGLFAVREGRDVLFRHVRRAGATGQEPAAP